MLDESARRALGGTRFGDVRWYAEVGSTNSVLADLARSGAPEGVVVVADHQTAGRGRAGRTWEEAPATGLLASVLLHPDLPPERTPLLTLLLSLAGSDACEQVAGVTALLKWPNDVVVDGAKVGGVLAESLAVGPGRAAVLGIGLNVKAAETLPPGAVALEAVGGRAVDRAALLVALLRSFDARYDDLQGSEGASRLLADYRARSATLGRRVRVELPGRTLEGVAADVTGEGHLVVAVGSERHVVSSGDVVHVNQLAGNSPSKRSRWRARSNLT
jgi:BirA family biotin operon repressor/biotin-[acetyl-CoA-carboxylase] ligase